MKISLVVPTRDRAGQIAEGLRRLPIAEIAEGGVEVVIVDNGSTDETPAVLARFVAAHPGWARSVREAAPGVSNARNAGIAAAGGDFLVFIDDDCYVDAGYFPALRRHLATIAFDYGGGQVLPFAPGDDPRMASRIIPKLGRVPPLTVLPDGCIQGANMFVHRRVFAKVGLFDPLLGAGTPYVCEDIEMATRASLGGFVGAVIPDLVVRHDHRRGRDSPEARRVLASYARGRGAYHAKLLAQDIDRAWLVWRDRFVAQRGKSPRDLDRLATEFEGAAAYLRQRIADDGR